MVNAIQTAMAKNKSEIFRGPVSVNLTFCLIKPKSTSKKIKFPCKQPDLDKLIRAAGDAMTGTIVLDDKQIVQVHARKEWETRGPGVEMIVMELPS